jgi:DNA-binding CsgD family transcriptional regulator
MMEEKCQTNFIPAKIYHPGFLNIVGYFKLQDISYLVIRIDEVAENLYKTDLPFSSDHSSVDTEFSQFTIDGQLCAVIKTDNPLPCSNSDVTTLLTEREFQIVQFVAQGQPNKKIANLLQISEWTITTHLRRIFAKLGVDSRAAMVYKCATSVATCVTNNFKS